MMVKTNFLRQILFIAFLAGCSQPKGFHAAADRGNFMLTNPEGKPLLYDCHASVTLIDGQVLSTQDTRYTGQKNNDGKTDHFLFKDKNGELDFDLTYTRLDDASAELNLKIHNRSDKSLFIQKIETIQGTLPKKNGLEKSLGLITAEDWQDDKIVFAFSDSLKKLQSMYTLALKNPSVAAGFLEGKQHFDHFTVTDTLQVLRLSAWGEGNGCELPAGASRATDPLFISFHDNSLQQMERFADLAAARNDVKLWPENRAVWCTWYAGWDREKMYDYKDGIAKGIQDNIPLIKTNFSSRGARTMRICDDHIAYGDWADVTRAFPQGLSEAATEVRAAGLIPGVWYPTYWASTGSEVFKNHPEWMAMEADGSPYILKDEFQIKSRLKAPNKFSVFDSSVPAVQDYFEKVAATWKNRGFAYVTNDFLAFATAPDYYHNKIFSKAQVLRAGMEAVKRGLGDDVFYRTIGGQFGTCLGLAHDVRIAGDSHGDRPFAYQRTGSAWFYNHRTWINDPSAIVFMRYGEFRDEEWNRMWISWIALAGTVMTYGEQLEELPEKYIDIYKRMFPPLKVAGRPLDLWENQPYTLWGMQPDKDDDSYCLFGVFDLDGQGKRGLSLNLDEVLSRATGWQKMKTMSPRYLLWDFWNEKLLETQDQELSLPMPKKSCRLFALRQYRGVPQLLGTNGHFSMGAIETENIVWNPATNTLTGKTSGNGGEATTLFFYVPSGFKLAENGLADKRFTYEIRDKVLAIEVPATTAKLDFAIKFIGKSSKLPTRAFANGKVATRY